MPSNTIDPAFVYHASDILADTYNGLKGSAIVRATNGHALKHGVSLPHPTYPFSGAVSKRTALYDNIMAFAPPNQYALIKDLCNHPYFKSLPDKSEEERTRIQADVEKLRVGLVNKYRHLAPSNEDEELNNPLVKETNHWLKKYPSTLSLYEVALQKYEHGIYSRNVLDDLRLSLEKFLHQLFQNEKSLEKQFSNLGTFIKQKGGSIEFSNMFIKLVEYFSKYQNDKIKHDDLVNEDEVEFVIEITSSFMKLLVKLNEKP